MKLLHSYKNGNYDVMIFNDGTKVRQAQEDRFIPVFPENIDLKISNQCDLMCPFCHENSTPDGKNAIFTHSFLKTLRRGTEISIGGGDVFANTEFIDFLKFCKQRGIVANITINQQHAAGKHKEKLKLAIKEKLVFGVGISYNNDYKTLNNLYDEFEKEGIDISNIVIHTINGINTYNDFEKIASKNRKVLILGYKDVRKGTEYRNSNNGKILVNQFDLFNNIEKLSDLFEVVSFDNLAIEQLEMKRFFDDEQWAEYYMGDEGQFTMYIDLVKEEFAINSCEVDKRHELLDTIDDMFSIIMKESDELQ